jgi:GntR family transcriptional regulator
MLFHVDPHNGIPIYEQIARHLKFRVADGSLTVGEHVPSVREMATRLAVNPNTVARAYRDLQGEGVLELDRGNGLTVTSDAPKRCKSARGDMVRQRLQSVFKEALQHGLTEDELNALAADALRNVRKGKKS